MKRHLFAILLAVASCTAWASVNINTATADDLVSVKGIGPAKAAAIIEYRQQHGAFKSLDELKNIKGFGDKSVSKLTKELVIGDTDGKTRGGAKK